MHLLVTRPRKDADALAQVLQAHGHEVTIDPLMSIEFHPDTPLTRTGVQALLITSANGLRAMMARADFSEWLRLPLVAVGPTTAALAREAGFCSVFEADGDVVSLVELVQKKLQPDGGPLLHIAGTVVAGDLKGALEADGFWVERAVLYEAKTADSLSPGTITGVRSGMIAGVLLYSKRSAETFVHLCQAAGLSGQLSGLNAYCLSANAALPLQDIGLRAIHVASAPNETDLLALLDPVSGFQS
ncbi:MAG: uroporphyrinogen-III synthase [Rhodobiaceae bacterium]|nr:uroporphyrinogen-III synthase [Rhodobiaceae bacterium]